MICGSHYGTGLLCRRYVVCSAHLIAPFVSTLRNDISASRYQLCAADGGKGLAVALAKGNGERDYAVLKIVETDGYGVLAKAMRGEEYDDRNMP